MARPGARQRRNEHRRRSEAPATAWRQRLNHLWTCSPSPMRSPLRCARRLASRAVWPPTSRHCRACVPTRFGSRYALATGPKPRLATATRRSRSRVSQSSFADALSAANRRTENEQASAQPIHQCGAIAVADLLITRGRSEADLVTMLSSLAATAIDIDDEVAASEAESGFRNHALAYFMKSFGKIETMW